MTCAPSAASIDLGTLALVVLVLVALVVLVLRGLKAAREPAQAGDATAPAAAVGMAPAAPAAPDAGEAPEQGEDALPMVRVEQDWRALDDPDREVDGDARGPLAPVDVLVARLRGGDSRTCERAIEDLVRHGRAAVPALEAALADPDADLRVDARRALDRIAGA